MGTIFIFILDYEETDEQTDLTMCPVIEMAESRGFKPRWSGSRVTVPNHHAKGLSTEFSLTLFCVAVKRCKRYSKVAAIGPQAERGQTPDKPRDPII